MIKFKQGDTVRYIPTGEIGIVENANESHCSVKSDIGTHHCLMTENLELVNLKEPMNTFNVGDRVTVVNGGIELSLNHDAKRFNGLTGKVTKVGRYIGVVFDERIGNHYSYDFFPHELEHTPKEPMNTFKVGDTVEVHGMVFPYEKYNSLVATVDRVTDRYGEQNVVIAKSSGASWETGQKLYFNSKNLRLIESQPTEFKAGDRVWFQGGIAGTTHHYAEPVEVEIVAAGASSILARFPTLEADYYVRKGQLSRISPQSPQPQTKSPYDTYTSGGWCYKPKEEDNMKPYAVIYQNLSSGDQSTIDGRYTTEAEAKEAADVLVAGKRASLTQKTYFTVTIVNTKTGELIGSVTDAPPAVDWSAGK